MKHKQSNRTLGRNATHRHHLFKQLVSDLLAYGSLITTVAKAKELQQQFEPLISSAKQKMSLAHRRQLTAKLNKATDLDQLIKVADAHAKRAGGYTRLSKLPVTRHDAAPTARVDIIDYPTT
jgi:large subunit ribosomal protein L17